MAVSGPLRCWEPNLGPLEEQPGTQPAAPLDIFLLIPRDLFHECIKELIAMYTISNFYFIESTTPKCNLYLTKFSHLSLWPMDTISCSK